VRKIDRRHFYVERFGIKFIEESLEEDENFDKLCFEKAQDYIPYKNEISNVISSINYCSLQYHEEKLADFAHFVKDYFAAGNLALCVQDIRIANLYYHKVHIFSVQLSSDRAEKGDWEDEICNCIFLNPCVDLTKIGRVGFLPTSQNISPYVRNGMLYIELENLIIASVYDPWIGNRDERAKNWKRRYDFISEFSFWCEKPFVVIGDFNPRSSWPIVGDTRNSIFPIPNSGIFELINLLPMAGLAIAKSQLPWLPKYIASPGQELRKYQDLGIIVPDSDTFKLEKPLIKQGEDLDWRIDAVQTTLPSEQISLDVIDSKGISPHRFLSCTIKGIE
jgi:hypothetical protein